MFCTNQKNAFLICKSSVFIPYYQSYSSEKQRKSNIFSLLPLVAHLGDEKSVALHPRLNSYCSSIVFKLFCWRISLLEGLPVCQCAGRQVSWRASRQASRTAGRLERELVCRPVCVCPYAFVYLLLHYYIDSQMYCTTDLHHPSSTP